jgi:hypothetical protein
VGSKADHLETEGNIMSRRTILRTAVAASLPLAAGVLLGWSAGPAGSKIAGTFQVKYAEQHPLAVPDAEGHALVLGRAQGVNRSTGATTYMDKGKVTNFEFADLTQGNGPQHGYISMSQGADTMISKWSGQVTTVLSSDKTPVTTMQGTWTKAKGTGRYADATGKGTYKGRFTSQTEYTVEWSGELSGEGLAER